MNRFIENNTLQHVPLVKNNGFPQILNNQYQIFSNPFLIILLSLIQPIFCNQQISTTMYANSMLSTSTKGYILELKDLLLRSKVFCSILFIAVILTLIYSYFKIESILNIEKQFKLILTFTIIFNSTIIFLMTQTTELYKYTYLYLGKFNNHYIYILVIPSLTLILYLFFEIFFRIIFEYDGSISKRKKSSFASNKQESSTVPNRQTLITDDIHEDIEIGEIKTAGTEESIELTKGSSNKKLTLFKALQSSYENHMVTPISVIACTLNCGMLLFVLGSMLFSQKYSFFSCSGVIIVAIIQTIFLLSLLKASIIKIWIIKFSLVIVTNLLVIP